MHFVMIIGSLCLAWALRYAWQSDGSTWQARWQKALVCFVLPPLLVMTTTIAVLCMGAEGQMIGLQAGRLSYAIALIFLLYSIFRSCQLAYIGWLSLQKLQKLVIDFNSAENFKINCEEPILLINIPILFAAQIGFWKSKLFISQGLLDTFDAPHLEAVLLHERAHAHYHDTFWFFWLGCLRQIMPWLPNTRSLWEELLLLRELRADRWATQHLDGLLVAESLLAMVSSSMTPTATFAAAFESSITSDRLEERIDFLLAKPEPLPKFSWSSLFWIGFSLLPLTVLPLHS